MEDKKPFKIELNKDDFSGSNIIIWRDSKMTHDDVKDLITAQNKQAILDRTQVLSKIIQKNGGKVRIDVAINLGVDGYQFIAGDIYRQILPCSVDKREKIRSYEIDLNNDPEAIRKLEYFVAVSLCYIQPTSTNPDTRSFLFTLVNEEGKSIVSFNGDQLLMAENVYKTNNVKRNYSPFTASSGGIIDISDFLMWDKISKYFILSEKKFRDSYLNSFSFSGLWDD